MTNKPHNRLATSRQVDQNKKHLTVLKPSIGLTCLQLSGNKAFDFPQAMKMKRNCCSKLEAN